jgi:hypothetical protein
MRTRATLVMTIAVSLAILSSGAAAEVDFAAGRSFGSQRVRPQRSIQQFNYKLHFHFRALTLRAQIAYGGLVNEDIGDYERVEKNPKGRAAIALN